MLLRSARKTQEAFHQRSAATHCCAQRTCERPISLHAHVVIQDWVYLNFSVVQRYGICWRPESRLMKRRWSESRASMSRTVEDQTAVYVTRIYYTLYKIWFLDDLLCLIGLILILYVCQLVCPSFCMFGCLSLSRCMPYVAVTVAIKRHHIAMHLYCVSEDKYAPADSSIRLPSNWRTASSSLFKLQQRWTKTGELPGGVVLKKKWGTPQQFRSTYTYTHTRQKNCHSGSLVLSAIQLLVFECL